MHNGGPSPSPTTITVIDNQFMNPGMTPELTVPSGTQ
jgi:hypothetical protein